MLFLDSANLCEIEEFLFLIDGVTTNPSMGSIDLNSILECLSNKHELHVHVNSNKYSEIINSVELMQKNIVVKIPICEDGLKACKYLSREGYKINMTLCFSLEQIYASYIAGAEYISLFLGRMKENNIDYNGIISNIRQEIRSKILGASIRDSNILKDAIRYLNHITLPYQILKGLCRHELTDVGFEKFQKQLEE